MRADSCGQFRSHRRHGVASAGDTHRRGRVDESTTRIECHRESFFRRGRSDKEDPVEVVLLGCFHPGAGFFRNEVGGDQSEPAGGSEVSCELVDAVLQYRVPVGHHDGLAADRTDLLDHGEDVAKANAVGECGFGCTLDGRTVHDRIGIRDTDFDDVAAAVDHRLEHVDRFGNGRITGRQVTDEGGTLVSLARGKGGCEA